MASDTSPPRVAGVLLAAGGGRRLGGRPKALLEDRGSPLVEHALRSLREGGCGPLHVVLGAGADRVRARADLAGCVVTLNPDWERGMGTSLRLGLAALADTAARDVTAADEAVDGSADAALVLLVDQPGIGAEAVARVRSACRSRADLIAAAYGGERGHPVLFGAQRWADVAAGAVGDKGAREYLREHRDAIRLVECSDVAQAYDIDTPEDLSRLE
ncbi:Nicotine blue oxidoreductase [Streptomyces sp. ADI96-02]|uniref:nucleotidyltransferase family protein n=1 Tax=Streptomyces sp. ADI96-02 TaxID=1522760 RepID=UPI000F5550FF|nr:nucleotidyltransferase family protein [Streptomyces sp. ADI96-02]RPK55960.1 Nicotine blue oxidoreductase [Streptomyces sp. ADI96-02]